MLNHITELITYLALVSMAAERLTEIMKRSFIKDSNAVPKMDGAIYQVTSGVFGSGIGYISPPEMGTMHINQYALIIIIGLAVSGGSGAWNSILEVLKQIAVAKASLNEKQ